MRTHVGDAWEELHTATPPGWQVGRPTYRVEQQQWALYAWLPESKLRAGKRTEEWTPWRRPTKP
jgi:hypothetical protein